MGFQSLGTPRFGVSFFRIFQLGQFIQFAYTFGIDKNWPVPLNPHLDLQKEENTPSCYFLDSPRLIFLVSHSPLVRTYGLKFSVIVVYIHRVIQSRS